MLITICERTCKPEDSPLARNVRSAPVVARRAAQDHAFAHAGIFTGGIARAVGFIRAGFACH
jgi:hypothetical protein